MAVFFCPSEAAYALVSFKSLYSKFTASDNWTYIGLDPTPRMLAKAIVSGRLLRTWFLIRSPYDRVVSCFMDKYRKQPTRINCEGFHWQHTHTMLYSHLGIDAQDSNENIAERFLSFTFDEFIDLLPRYYRVDEHLYPQYWTVRVLASGRWFPWPAYRLVHTESSDELAQVPAIDFSRKTNTTGEFERDFTLDDRHRAVIRRLYRKDFALGEYSE